MTDGRPASGGAHARRADALDPSGPQRLSFMQTLLTGLLVFGLFFGAGNIIFPVKMGYLAGTGAVGATLGFLVTAVGLTMLGIVAAAVARSTNLYDAARPVARWYALAYTCALYLTIGPLFAIPRTATVSYEVGVRPLVGELSWGPILFSVVFFALTLVFALRPGRLIDWVGKYLTPIFLALLAIIVVACVVHPMTAGPLPPPVGPYGERGPFVAGLLDGYNTMDALGSMAMCIVIFEAMARFGVTRPSAVVRESAKASLVGGLGMAIVYAALVYVGASTVGVIEGPDAANGGTLIAAVSRHYFGMAGQYLIAAIVFVACLKTAIGLTTACAEMFAEMFPRLSLRAWTFAFVAASFGIANVGLDTIIAISVPVLMFLYPLVITLVLMSLAYPWLHGDQRVFAWTTGATALAAFFDLVGALPGGLASSAPAAALTGFAKAVLPGYALGFGWVVPAIIGFVIGLVLARRGGGLGARTVERAPHAAHADDQIA